MTANYSKFYLGYLNKLVCEYNNTYHHSIDKKHTNSDNSALPEEIKTNPKVPKLKIALLDRVRVESVLICTRIFLGKAAQKLVKRSICCWFYVKN